jgi:hypothetical protein
VPATKKLFYEQLKDRKAGLHYEFNQRAIWQKGVTEGSEFPLTEGWSVAILPMIVDGERFTLSIFLC